MPSQDHTPHSWPWVLTEKWPVQGLEPDKGYRQRVPLGSGVLGSAQQVGDEGDPELPRPEPRDYPQPLDDLKYHCMESYSQYNALETLPSWPAKPLDAPTPPQTSEAGTSQALLKWKDISLHSELVLPR